MSGKYQAVSMEIEATCLYFLKGQFWMVEGSLSHFLKLLHSKKKKVG